MENKNKVNELEIETLKNRLIFKVRFIDRMNKSAELVFDMEGQYLEQFVEHIMEAYYLFRTSHDRLN